MSFHISKLLLYSNKGELKTIRFPSGEVSLLFGPAVSGKSSVAPIVRYCLGDPQCHIPIGKIRASLSWVGTVIENADQEIRTILRKVPKGKTNTSPSIIVRDGFDPTKPVKANCRPVVLRDLLAEFAGLEPSIMPQGRRNIKTFFPSLAFSFRFHKNIPAPRYNWNLLRYFLLGDPAQTEARVELHSVKALLRDKEKDLAAHQERLSQRALSLFDQARSLGFEVAGTIDHLSGMRDAIQNLKQKIEIDDFQDTDPEIAAQISSLRAEKKSINASISALKKSFSTVDQLIEIGPSYAWAVDEQRRRLGALDLFSQVFGYEANCPICDVAHVDGRKYGEPLQRSIDHLYEQWVLAHEQRGQLEPIREQLNEELRVHRALLRNTNRQMKSLLTVGAGSVRSDLASSELKGRLAEFEILLGPELAGNLEREISGLQLRLDQLQISTNDNLDDYLDEIASDISAWAQHLELEHSNLEIKIDLKKRTLLVGNLEQPIQLAGSDENWYTYGMLFDLAFLKFFIKKDSGVPRFIFLDNPTQGYGPRLAMNPSVQKSRIRMEDVVDLVLDINERLEGNLQIVITDSSPVPEVPPMSLILNQDWLDEPQLVPEDW